MRKAFQILAGLVALEVMVQASMIAWAMFGFGHWIDQGNVFNKALLDDQSTFHFTEERGFMIHGINGQMVIPLVALILFIVSFFAKEVPGAVKMAGGILVLIVIQVMLGIFGHDTPIFGVFHGINALLIFGAAIMASKAAGTKATAADAVAA